MDTSQSLIEEDVSEDAIADDRSFANKMSHLESTGLVTPIVVGIPLDDDLANIYASLAFPGKPLTSTEILLIQVLRLLRATKNE